MVVECSCGMVMSISTKAPRAYCIRCGGIEFQVIGNFAGHLSRSGRTATAMDCHAPGKTLAFDSSCYAIVACTGEGSDI
jgi:hypothetical protein